MLYFLDKVGHALALSVCALSREQLVQEPQKIFRVTDRLESCSFRHTSGEVFNLATRRCTVQRSLTAVLDGEYQVCFCPRLRQGNIDTESPVSEPEPEP